jgi:thioesterase domain-containing protein/acyl carrier protein
MRYDVKASSGSVAINQLIPIWERVLQRSPIGVNDNFFDLGGDSLLAVNLFFEIEQAFGREMPPVMIYQAPTIAALAAELELPSASRFPPLVLLKPGNNEPPIFIAHGLGGSVIDFYQLVKYIDSPQPIYGMQARGIDGVDEPFDRIEDLAQFYLNAIKEIQPHGPYYLVGYSLGGLVTLEMAQRLTQDGEQVALLAMLESYPHSKFLALGQRLRLAARVAKHRAYTMCRLPLRDALTYIMLPSRRRFYFARTINGNGNGTSKNEIPNAGVVSPTMQRARDTAYLALSRYQPRRYSGKIKFVRAEMLTDFPDDPVAVWKDLVAEFECTTVPGDHLGIVGTHFEHLGSALSKYLRGASDNR